MEKFINNLKNTLGIILGIIVLIILIPILILSAPFNWWQERTFKRDYQNFLLQMNGKNFFCYNNRSRSIEFIKSNILPNLPESVEVIFLNGRTPESAYEQRFISHALYGFKNYQGFPQLLKIRNGSTFDESLNNDLFNTIQQNKPTDELFERMAYFFGLLNNEKDAA